MKHQRHVAMGLALAALWGCGDASESSPAETDVVKLDGLLWQHVPPNDAKTFADAKTYCAELELAGRREWRLPTISELRELIVGCEGRQAGGACDVADPGCLGKECYVKEDCGHCPEKKGPAGGCYWKPGLWEGSCTDQWFTWTTSPFNGFADHYWVVRFQGGGLFDDGVVGFNEELGDGSTRCVHEN